MSAYDAFLLVSFGGPEGPEDVMPFLRNVTAGRNVPDSRLEAWERWEQPALAVLPYVMLTVAVVISLITRRGPWTPPRSTGATRTGRRS